ncbi:hypothetical protein Tcan_13726 [Toxocara canis]|uniref:Uncharacterized protein n=1 Tax=Toxocara canis TaxID=6265 RepID=A0A0B2UU89_TOXCA|nr:hypothetical protein Tcan_13726 [Toxocara canis]
MSQMYEPVVPLEGAPMPEPQKVEPPPPAAAPPPPPPDEQKDVQENYEAIADFGEVQYVPGAADQAAKPDGKKKGTKSEVSSEKSGNSGKTKKRQPKKRRRGKRHKISLWVYAIVTFMMLVAATACTVSFVHGVVEYWFI